MHNLRVCQKRQKRGKKLSLEKKNVYICQSVGLLCCALCFIGWVAQGKDDWPFIQGSHGLDDIMGKQTSSSCHTWKKGETDLLLLFKEGLK